LGRVAVPVVPVNVPDACWMIESGVSTIAHLSPTSVNELDADLVTGERV
jgi:hypothetical protein